MRFDKIGDRATRDDPTVVDERDGGRELFDLVQVVRRVHDRRTRVGEAANQREDLVSRAYVGAGRRLVEEHERRTVHERDRGMEPPPFTAGDVGTAAIEQRGQAERVPDGVDALPAFAFAQTGESGEVVLNNLYNQTQLQGVYGINCVALVDGQPQVLNLKQMLEAFIKHRREVVTRRTVFLLRRARQRGHILEGQAVALSNIDRVVELIRSSPDAAEARARLIAQGWTSANVMELLSRAGSNACRPDDLPEQFGVRDGLYYLSEEQAQAILDLRLHRLTALEQTKLIEEYQGILDEITQLLAILGSTGRLLDVIRGELKDIRERYGDDRLTEIVSSHLDLSVEDLISVEDVVVTISHQGYAKTQPISDYQAQRRGGRGRAATAVKDEDFVEHLLVASSHDTLLSFSDFGKVYWIKVYLIPQASRGAKGRPLVNMLPLEANERITAILPIRDFAEDAFVFMATANGTVKKTPLEQFSRPRTAGLIALDLDAGNTLVGAALTDGSCDVLLISSAGKAARFKESDVRAMGRSARGVRGIRLTGGHRLIALIVPQTNGYILAASEHGYGKRTAVTDFPLKGRGTQGVIAMQISERNGAMIGAVQVFDGDELMLISDQGTLVRTPADQVSLVGRNTQGVRLIAIRDDETLVRVARIVETIAGGDDSVVVEDALDAGVDAPADTDDSPEDPETE